LGGRVRSASLRVGELFDKRGHRGFQSGPAKGTKKKKELQSHGAKEGGKRQLGELPEIKEAEDKKDCKSERQGPLARQRDGGVLRRPVWGKTHFAYEALGRQRGVSHTPRAINGRLVRGKGWRITGGIRCSLKGNARTDRVEGPEREDREKRNEAKKKGKGTGHWQRGCTAGGAYSEMGRVRGARG